MKDPVICRNCGTSLNGNYCINCGQKASVHKITFRETFRDFIDAVFSVNSPLWYTFKLLIRNPGKLFKEYIDGKRKL